MRKFKGSKDSQKGAVAALLAIMLPAFIGALGLAVDTGSTYELNRRMQTAADSAALAAAHELRGEKYERLKLAAAENAKLNGFESDDDTEIDVHRPPISGAFKGDDTYVEVRVKRKAPMFFMSTLVKEPKTIIARSVAGSRPGSNCIYVLNDGASAAFEARGTPDIRLQDCGMLINSDHHNAAVTGGDAVVQAAHIDIVGDYSGPGFQPEPATGAYAQDDPFADLDVPAHAPCQGPNPGATKYQNEVTLNPGVYCGGWELNSDAKINLNPGQYILVGGGLTAHGGATIEGTGVTIFNTAQAGYAYDRIWFNGGSVAKLEGPKEGEYKGMVFFQDPDIESNKANVFNGNAEWDIKGILYFPTTHVKMTGTFDASAQQMMLISDTLEFSGTANFAKLDKDFVPNVLTVARVVE